MANFDLTNPVEVNGKVYQPEDLNQSILLVDGVEPTEFEQYLYCNILAKHTNGKQTDKYHAVGKAQGAYLYPVLEDMPKFYDISYPCRLSVVTTKMADKKGKMRDLVLFVDFANAVELDLVPRKPRTTIDSSAVNKVEKPALSATKV